MSEIDERRATAIHEAGHAVISIRERRRFRHVTIAESDHFLGQVLGMPVGDWLQPDLTVDARTRRWIEQQIAILLAGGIAEARHRGLDDTSTLDGCEFDNGNVASWAMYATASIEETNAYIAWLYERTKNRVFLDDTWSAIEHLADRLLEVGTLSYPAARAVVAESDAALMNEVRERAAALIQRLPR